MFFSSFQIRSFDLASFDLNVQASNLLNLRYCDAFPAIKGAIQRVKREENRVQYDTSPSKNRSSKSRATTRSNQSRATTRSNQSRATTGFTLQRRLSTATPVNYNMYVAGSRENIFCDIKPTPFVNLHSQIQM